MRIFQIFKMSVFGLFLFLTTQAYANTKILICTDTNFWYPFTYVKNQEAVGLHIDIISRALRNLGYEPTFHPTSWQQCLKSAQQGKVDAVASASYRDERATYLKYPEGAATDRKSPFRVTQVEYVVITPAINQNGKVDTYEFKGDVKKIPEPVRVPIHYSVVQDLEKEGLKVDEGKNSLENFKHLVKERTGSVIDIEEVADHLATQPEFADKLNVQKRPLNLKSYYLAFAKSGKIKPEDSKRIWAEIKKVRDNPTLMAEFLKKY